MKHTNRKSHIPLWKLERFQLGELPGQEMERIRRQIDENPDLQFQLEDLRKQYADLDNSYPSGEMIRGIRSRLKKDKPAFSIRQSGMKNLKPAFGILALLILLPLGIRMFRPAHNAEPALGGLEETRIKGMNPELYLFRKTDKGSQPLEPGARAAEGDRIQILYNAAGMKYGTIVSVDGADHTTYHFPEGRKKAVKLVQGSRVPLDFSFEFDDTPGKEKFFFITSHHPFNVDTVLSSIITSDSNSSNNKSRIQKVNKLTVTTFTIIKERES